MWFYKHVKQRDFDQGDLVLLYSVKGHKQKMKFQGLGPFRARTISRTGNVELETLEGEGIGFFNGSRMKKYYPPSHLLHEPPMLEAPVNVCVAIITELTDQDEEAVAPAYLRITVTVERMYSFDALIDEGVDYNILTHDHWTRIGQPKLQSTNAKLGPFGSNAYSLLGKCKVAVSIESKSIPIFFYMLPNTKGAGNKSLLGRTFKKQTNCNVDYSLDRIHLAIGNVRIVTTFSKGYLDPSTIAKPPIEILTTTPILKSSKKDCDVSHQAQITRPKPTKAAQKAKQHTLVWVPKRQGTPPHNQQKRACKRINYQSSQPKR